MVSDGSPRRLGLDKWESGARKWLVRNGGSKRVCNYNTPGESSYDSPGPHFLHVAGYGFESWLQR